MEDRLTSELTSLLLVEGFILCIIIVSFILIVKEAILRMCRGFPVVAITGPRQSGKTTLARALFPDKSYVSLEDPDARAFADSDPRTFLGRYPDGAILDEVQRCPDLFSYIQTIVDREKRMAMYVLTGSQQFGLHSKITQSLAGRVGMVQLLPFSYGELADAGRALSDLARGSLSVLKKVSSKTGRPSCVSVK